MKKQTTKKYHIVRTYSAGVFMGIIKSRKGAECVLTDARRLWQWQGAASLSELCTRGTSKPGACKFPAEVPEVTLLGVIEILPVSKGAKATIDSVPVWSV